MALEFQLINNYFVKAEYSENIFVIAADDGLYRSNDGKNYTLVDTLSDGDGRGVGYAGGKFVAVKYNSDYSRNVRISTDGSSWSNGTYSALRQRAVEGGMYNGSMRFVLSKYKGDSRAGWFYSTDGTEFLDTNHTSFSTQCDGIAFGNNIFVATNDCNGGEIYRSTNGGQTFDGPSDCTIYQETCEGLSFCNGKFFVYNGGTSNYLKLAYSTDGKTWTKDVKFTDSYHAGTVPSDLKHSFAYGNGTYVFVRGKSIYYTKNSDVSVTWTKSSTELAYPAIDICFAHGLFVIVLSNSSGAGVVTSTDGQTWSTGTVIASANAITHN